MPNGNYASENGEKMFETVIKMPQADREGVKFTPGLVKPGNPGKVVPASNLASDQESFTGKSEGFFAKFGSDSTEQMAKKKRKPRY